MSETLSPELQSWVGRTRVVEEDVGLAAVRRIAGMLDMDPAAFRNGDKLPPHWFTMFFADVARQSDIGPDGHPNPAVFLPPILLPRRMGAGRRVTIHDTLRVGEVASKTAEVAAILPKQARTGFITVLTMRHTIRREGQVIAVDEFDAIYREAVKPGEKSGTGAPMPAPTDAAWRVEKHLSSPLVFRYSAVTWNAHRIHYDADYSRQVEGYPNTVQNGGLTMQLLLDAAVANTPGTLRGFTARLTRPIYVGDTVTLCGHAPKDGRVNAWVQDKDGYLCAQLDCEFA
ncbi:HTD2 family dehydratase [Siccirubricoccus phaeus]|uniref:MaoC family dehydratase N-terminal domain-containing protein n=1 Tax=Siccirubricoccus phaeus TaxID=2595053 RepID=UPI0011F0F4F4|nr:MaoC family dehydratase N-terminal domain-containing protein [Siccirubricoccus phaeus]